MEDKLHRYNSLYMDLADRISGMSHAVRLKVGCLLVKDGNIISFGWNGMPAGWDNGCEYIADVPASDPRYDYASFTKELRTKPEVLHSEANCLMKLARTSGSAAGASMFCTHAPCMQCAKLIYGAGVGRLYYRNTYRDTSGLEFLDKSGVKVEKFG